MPKTRNKTNHRRKASQARRIYQARAGRSDQPRSLWRFFRESPLVGLELEFERNKDASRDVDL